MDPSEQARAIPLALRAAYMALHRCSESKFVDLGVTADQFVLMLAINEAGKLTQRELADRISSDPSTVRAMLVLLEKNGLVLREPHPLDTRAKSVKLTTAGKRKLRLLWKAGQPIRDGMHRALSEHESDELIRLLHIVADALGQGE